MRVFAAIVPPALVLDHLEMALDQVIPVAAHRRNPRTPRSTWHVTLAFFGEVPEGHVPELAAGLGAVAAEHAPFDLELSGAGTFSTRTAWMGVAGSVDRLRALTLDVRELWDASAEERPGQSHKPHLTISRHPFRADLGNPVKALAVYRGPTWTVSEAVLFRSDLGQGVAGHALHTPLATARLGLSVRSRGIGLSDEDHLWAAERLERLEAAVLRDDRQA